MYKPEPDLRPHSQAKAELDVQVSEGLEQTCIPERACIDGIKPYIARHFEHVLLSLRIIGSDESREILVADMPGFYMLSENCVKRFYNPGLWCFFCRSSAPLVVKPTTNCIDGPSALVTSTRTIPSSHRPPL